MVLESCPFCHRPFAAEQISKDQIDSDTEDLLEDPPTKPTIAPGPHFIYPSPKPTPVDFYTTYKIVYQCKHCGRQWAKTETVDKEVDRRIAGPEQASDADVEREEEEAREEQHEEQY